MRCGHPASHCLGHTERISIQKTAQLRSSSFVHCLSGISATFGFGHLGPKQRATQEELRETLSTTYQQLCLLAMILECSQQVAFCQAMFDFLASLPWFSLVFSPCLFPIPSSDSNPLSKGSPDGWQLGGLICFRSYPSSSKRGMVSCMNRVCENDFKTTCSKFNKAIMGMWLLFPLLSDRL